MADDPKFCSVLLDSGIKFPLEYRIPEELLVKRGSRVLVPLRSTVVKGTVLECYDSAKNNKALDILSIVHDSTALTDELYTLAKMISYYWCTPLKKVLQTMVPKAVKNNVLKRKEFIISSKVGPKILVDHIAKKRAKKPAQAALLELFLEKKELPIQEASSKSALKALLDEGLLESKEKTDPFSSCDYFPQKPKNLSDEQQIAVDALTKSIQKGSFETFLLFGVTGSGKTEVYIRAIEETLKLNKGVIFLVPEIALAEQTIARFRSRFINEPMAILHHRLSDGERNDDWQAILKGEARIVIGARSALFSPMSNIGLIIVDEEHEAAYKQSDEMPSYNGRDLALLRAKNVGATAILGSATPSFESYTNALKGKYQLLTLKNRPSSIALPKIELVDMTIERERGMNLFSNPLIKAIEERLKKGEQTILFLNRRGTHTTLLCPKCKKNQECPHCSIPLTFHKSNNKLLCHLCNFAIIPPTSCPSCGHETLKYRGAGTEQVERAIHALFPEVRTLRLDADTTKEKGKHEELYKAFATGKADILVGTQMVAKGLHFPYVTLVGVLNADHHLHIPDFRSSELTFQQIVQVAGRSGRSSIAGTVILQTLQKESTVIQKAIKGDFTGFYEEEMETRKLFNFPPHQKMVKFLFKGTIESEVLSMATLVHQALILKLPATFQFFPVTPSGYAKIKDEYRFQFLLISPQITALNRLIQEGFLESYEVKKKVKIRIDVDPLSTYF